MILLSLNNISKAQVAKIKEIEKKAYPLYMQTLQDVDSIEDIRDYAESHKVEILLGENFYMILGFAEDYIEVVDFAAAGKFNIFKVLNSLAEIAKDNGYYKITADFREETSYKILKAVIRRRKDLILHEIEEWYWGEEKFVNCEILYIGDYDD